MIEIEIDEDGKRAIVESWNHVHLYQCEKCFEHVSSKPDSMIDGTIIGKNFLVKITRFSKSNKSNSELCETIEIAFEKELVSATIQKALNLATPMMEPECEVILENMENGTAGNIDETRVHIGDDTGWMWVLIVDNKWVMFHPATTRGKSVLETKFPFPHLKITSDAYIVYKSFFKTLQLCWAHVKTKVRNGVTKKPSQEAQHLHKKLIDIYRHAKTLPPQTPPEEINDLISSVKHIGQQLLDIGIKAGTYVINCADMLFTAVINPEMSLTNNLAERTIRGFVIKRKVSYRFATMTGAQKYATIASCLHTWKLQEKDPDKELRRLFDAATACG